MAEELEKNFGEETSLDDKADLSNILHNKGKLPSLRTYQGDVASFIKSKDKSVAEIAIKNKQEKEEREKKEESGERKNFFAPVQTKEQIKAEHKKEDRSSRSPSFLISILAIVLLGTSVIVGIYVYTAKVKDQPIEINGDSKTVIRTSQSVVLDAESLNKNIFEQTVKESKINPKYFKGLTNFEFSNASTKSLTTVSDFINKVGWNIPASLIRSLDPSFMIGLSPNGDSSDLFLILKVKDYGIGFRDMLAWEDYMNADLGKALNIPNVSVSDYQWKDLIVKNKDTRALSSASGKVSLIYTFINQNTILVTESESSITSIVNSFVAGNTVR